MVSSIHKFFLSFQPIYYILCVKSSIVSVAPFIFYGICFKIDLVKKYVFQKSVKLLNIVFLYLLKSFLGLQAVVFQWDEKSTMSTSAFLLPFSSAPQSMNKKNLFCFFCFMTKKIDSFGSLSSSQEYHFHQHQAADLEEKN